MHLVAVYAQKLGLVLPKRGVGEREARSPGTVVQVDLTGRVVTGDALYNQKNLSRQVVDQGGSYFWVVKDNQPGLRAGIALLFDEPPWGEDFAAANGDRWEERNLWASTALNDYLALSNLTRSNRKGDGLPPV